MATPYVKQTWIDGDTTKPLSAARLGVIETGIFDAHYKPAVAVYKAAVQSIPNTTATALVFDTELFDTDGEHSTVTNTSRLTAAVTGKRMITGAVQLAANATGVRILDLRVNGTTIIDEDISAGFAGANSVLRVAKLYLLSASDYVELIVQQTSGGALNAGPGVAAQHFSMHLAAY